jgi:hypothetical protein
MSIYDDLSYTYPREIIIALIITAIVFWFGLRMTRKAERRFLRTRAAAPPLTPAPDLPHSGECRGESPSRRANDERDGESESSVKDFVAVGQSGAVATAGDAGTESE